MKLKTYSVAVKWTSPGYKGQTLKVVVLATSPTKAKELSVDFIKEKMAEKEADFVKQNIVTVKATKVALISQQFHITQPATYNKLKK